MFGEVADLLGGFQNFILCLVIGVIIITVITLAGFSLFGFEHPLLGWYALFLNDKRRRTVSFALSILRMLYLGAVVGMAGSLNLTHVLVFLLFTVLLWGSIFRIHYILYDLLYSAGVSGIVYLLYLMHKELNKVQVQSGMVVLTVLFSVLLVIAAVGQFFITMNGITIDKVNKTERDIKIHRYSCILLACLLVVLILPYFVITHTGSITLKQGGIQFANGETVRIAEGSKLSQTDNGCMISHGDDSFLLADTPLYDKANDSVIFTEYCSIVQPKIQMTNRISPMCSLEKEGTGFVVRNGEYESQVENFFLFDGNDTYYFPGQTVLEWGEESVTLSAFSKVDVSYNRKIEIFDYEKESYSVYENVEGFCIAKLQGEEQVNLSTDILYRENGDEQMLFMQPMLLKDLE